MLKRDDMALSLPNGKLDDIFHNNDVSTTSPGPLGRGPEFLSSESELIGMEQIVQYPRDLLGRLK